jgi:ParB-like chromosome segregation protein Spo0J
MENIIKLIGELTNLPTHEKIEVINKCKLALHEISPFKNEPVDCVLWVQNQNVHANDYNPNSVAPPEMALLHVSISEDGYTQPIVTMLEEEGTREVIDGFHRHRVGKEYADIQSRVNGYLPVVTINLDRTDKSDRIASTIRHNRARGKHKVESMSEIVVELKKRNWSDEKISKNLGMDADEVLRLCQISGIAEMFKDHEFSKAWEVDSINDNDNLIIEEENIN